MDSSASGYESGKEFGCSEQGDGGQVEGGDVYLFQASTYLISSVICMNRDVIHLHFLAARPVRRECPVTPFGAPQVSQVHYRSSALPKLTQASHGKLSPSPPALQKA